MKALYEIHHGSSDSLDTDVYVVLDQPILNIQECKEYCEAYQKDFKNYNVNIITITNNIVDWCYKGTVDEVNNSIYYTYSLHTNNLLRHLECPVKLVQRDLEAKLDRTMRGLLSYLSRTEYRVEVKEALKSTSYELKAQVLSNIDIRTISNFGKKGTNTEVYKFFAFQLAQSISLARGLELFTKQEAATLFPELKDALYRTENETITQSLYDLIHLFIVFYRGIKEFV